MFSHSFPVPVSCSLQVSILASQPTESAAGGEPCGEPAISLHSLLVSLVQWTTCLLPVTRDPGSNPQGGYLCETRILLLAMSRYNPLLPAEPRLYKNQFVVTGPTGPLASLHSFTIPSVLRSKPAGTGTICPFILCPRLFDPHTICTRTFYPGVLHPLLFHP
jgi:hypothetical protein